ncbi:MAG: lysophospholipase [Austwickia sp.]|nr:alpha/beta hydrolase [Actinomycetota bacterium]MCB1253602.1 alpha/beta hydrolase [Austwickia sp.]MCO5309872.1 lysophospholipase [Austwickia sp.]
MNVNDRISGAAESLRKQAQDVAGGVIGQAHGVAAAAREMAGSVWGGTEDDADVMDGVKVLDGFLDVWMHGVSNGLRAPVLRRPNEVGLDYEDVFFTSLDGVPLEGWFIPADSDQLVIQNHFLPGNRYGYPGHLPEFNSVGGFEVNLMPWYKALHDAGYNILTYDLRNHGLSGAANGGIVGMGLLEYRDVVGSVRYAKFRGDTAAMTTHLFSACLGANATCIAMAKHPEDFENIASQILLQPLSGHYVIEEYVKTYRIPAGYGRFEWLLRERTGFNLAEQSPLESAAAIGTPTMVAQVRDDRVTRPEDVQSIYDALPAADKTLHWIEGTNRRFDAYNTIGEHPAVYTDWFGAHR